MRLTKIKVSSPDRPVPVTVQHSDPDICALWLLGRLYGPATDANANAGSYGALELLECRTLEQVVTYLEDMDYTVEVTHG